MTKKTTSDELKTLFTQFGGEEKDWKRLSKKKNGEGQWVREFENKKTGVQLEVVETGEGKFQARQIGAGQSLTVEANQNFAKEEPAVEVTEDIIDDLMNDGFSPGMPQDQADKVLAGLHCFAICMAEGFPTAMITPIRYFEQTGYCDDQSGSIGGILTGCYELMEATWGFEDIDTIKTPVDAANHLRKLGITWRKDFQDFIDSSVTKELEVWAQSAPKAPAVRKSEPKI